MFDEAELGRSNFRAAGTIDRDWFPVMHSTFVESDRLARYAYGKGFKAGEYRRLDVFSLELDPLGPYSLRQGLTQIAEWAGLCSFSVFLYRGYFSTEDHRYAHFRWDLCGFCYETQPWRADVNSTLERQLDTKRYAVWRTDQGNHWHAIEVIRKKYGEQKEAG